MGSVVWLEAQSSDSSGMYDPDMDIVSYKWNVSLAGGASSVNKTFGGYRFPLEIKSLKQYNVTVVVWDGLENSSVSYPVYIKAGHPTNQPPKIPDLYVDTPSASAAIGAKVNFFANNSFDPEGNPIIFEWFIDGNDRTNEAIQNLLNNSSTFSLNIDKSNNVSVRVTDGVSASPFVSIQYSSVDTPPTSPIIMGIYNQSFFVGDDVDIIAYSNDEDGDTVEYHWVIDSHHIADLNGTQRVKAGNNVSVSVYAVAGGTVSGTSNVTFFAKNRPPSPALIKLTRCNSSRHRTCGRIAI